MANIIPKPSDVPDVASPKPDLVVFKDDNELDRAAQDAGLNVLNAKTLRALKRIGQHIAPDLIYTQISRALAADQGLDSIEGVAREIAEDAGQSAEDRISAVKAFREIQETKLRSIELTVGLVEKDLVPKPQGPKRGRGFAVGEIIQPVQVNVHTAGGSRVEVVPAG